MTNKTQLWRSILHMYFLLACVTTLAQCERRNKRLEGNNEAVQEQTRTEEDVATRARRNAESVAPVYSQSQNVAKCGINLPPEVGNGYIARSCIDHFEHGHTKCGYYVIHDCTESYVVYCDMNTEVGFAWTLIESYALKFNGNFKDKALFVDHPINENSPNWNLYRLSKSRMSRIRDKSTYWRATCDFQKSGVDYRDYVRAKVSDVDLVVYSGEGTCAKVEYINLRGHVGVGVTVGFWNSARYHFHTDSTYTGCSFDARSGVASSEDNWGFYHNTNSAFRCTSSSEATTQFWYGEYIKIKE